MTREFPLCCLAALLALGIVSGCKRSHPASGGASGYFHTHFQDESQFIVETIVSDLAEQIYYAKFHRLPEPEDFSVSASETADSTGTMPVYDVRIDLDGKHQGLATKLKIGGPIWSPEVYDDLAAQLARSVGLTPGAAEGMEDTALLGKLTDGLATTIEGANESISRQLDTDFANPSLH